MITKQIAGILYSFSYQLQDNEGNVWDITGLDPTRMSLNFSRLVKFSEIGSTYKILAREKEQLTNEIMAVIASIESRTSQNSEKYTYGFEGFIRGLSFTSHTPCARWYEYHTNKLEDHTDSSHYELQLYSLNPLRLIKSINYKPNYVGSPWYVNRVFNQQLIEDELRRLHFNLDFPEGTTTNLI